jgi:hypothetical protein
VRQGGGTRKSGETVRGGARGLREQQSEAHGRDCGENGHVILYLEQGKDPLPSSKRETTVREAEGDEGDAQ